MTRSVFTPKYEKFRHLLVEARMAKGINQQLLARRLSRHQSFVSNFERGLRRLDVIEFFDIAEALGIDPFSLLRKLHPKRKR